MKKQGWEKILTDYIDSQLDKRFRWGSNDCVLFAAKGAHKILTENLMPAIKSYGNYNEQDAGSIIKEYGGSIANIFDKWFPQRASAKQARRGDIALVDYNGNEAAGLVDCSGRHVVCKAPVGVTFVPVSNIIVAWDVEGFKCRQ